jgi:2-(1,2-epoxy-1,2-dihydrophenyl)acetyl-CoA isomerase
MANPKEVHQVIKQGVLTLTFNRPKTNAFSEGMILASLQAINQAAEDSRVRCMVISGTGNYFSTGRDLNDVLGAKDESFQDHIQRTLNPLILAIRNLEKPVIGAINGTVAGASLGVALACDLRIAAEEAQFIVGFTGIGLGMDSGVSLFLPKLIGMGRASEFAFTNVPISAQQAMEWGLVNKLAPADQIHERAHEWALEIARGPIKAMGLVKRSLNAAIFGNLAAVLNYEAEIQDAARQGDEFREGLQAFLEKRPARFV